MPIARLSFFDSSLMWNFQVSLLSIRRPRYLMYEDSKIFLPSRFKMIRSQERLGGRKMINSVLSTFSESLLAQSHSTSFLRALLTVRWRLRGLLSANRRLVSSAKWCTRHSLKTLCMSLMYIVKSSGPRIDPCGTPQETFISPEVQPLRLTLCDLFVR